MLHIYWGNGKGKTSSLNGNAIRAYGANMKVGIFRFLKGIESSEDEVLKKIGIEVNKIHYGTKFVYQMTTNEKKIAKKEILKWLKYIENNFKKFDIIILDEILDLCAKNVAFLSEEKLIDFIKKIKNKKIVMISGHKKLKKLFLIADLITYFKEIKHYFNKKLQAKKGIEF